MDSNIYGHAVSHIDGKKTTLKEYEGKVLLIVNVASKCGLTPQYTALEGLHEKYAGKGLAVLGFPANEFAGQEPGSNHDIQTFCQSNFGVKFDMFQKIVVKGEGIHPLYEQLTHAKPKGQGSADSEFQKNLAKHGIKREKPEDVLWNFEKFLVDRKGSVVERFDPDVLPDDPRVIKALEAALAKK